MLRVLVVEDEELIRQGIVLTVDWQALECQVVGQAANGEEGLQAARQLHPDLIITDIRMPRLDGLEMLRALREEGCQSYVIILTAYDSFEYAQSALRLGAVDFLLKPFHDGDLEQAVAQLRRRMNLSAPEEVSRDTLLEVKQGGKSRYVAQTMEYISQHYNDSDISVGAVAQHLGLSEGHLSHTFKRETGCTLSSYLTRYRVYRAKQLLQEGTRKVYEVAEQVGYKDITYFSATFKKLVGVSPSEYQNSRRTGASR